MPGDDFRHPLHLVGRTVELVPLGPSHVSALAPGLRDRETVQFLRSPPAPTPAATEAWIQRWVELGRTGPDLPFATVLRSTGTPVGMTSFLRLDRSSRGVEIGGTWIDRAYWRSAVNTEAKWLMLTYAFDRAKYHRVQLQTDLRNRRSQRAIEGLGAVPEAHLRDDVVLGHGTFRTSVYYSILEEEWPRVRRILEGRLGRAGPRVPSEPIHPPGKPGATSEDASAPVALPPTSFRRPVSLSGRYVTLVPLERADLAELVVAGAPPEIWTWLRIRHGDSPEGMAALVDDLLRLEAKGEVLPFKVRWNSDQRVLGIARYLDIDRPNRWAEVGTWLHPGAWRTPANTELKLLLFRHAFETEGAHRVQLKTDDRNLRSQKAIDRLGAVYEGVRRDHYRFPNGEYRTSRYYSILAQEWPDVRKRLEERLARPWAGALKSFG